MCSLSTHPPRDLGHCPAVPARGPGTQAGPGHSKGLGVYRGGRRLPELLCGPSCSLPVRTLCGATRPSLQWLRCWASVYSWEPPVLGAGAWCPQAPRPDPCCSSPPQTLLSWQEGHSCPPAGLCFRGCQTLVRAPLPPSQTALMIRMCSGRGAAGTSGSGGGCCEWQVSGSACGLAVAEPQGPSDLGLRAGGLCLRAQSGCDGAQQVCPRAGEVLGGRLPTQLPHPGVQALPPCCPSALCSSPCPRPAQWAAPQRCPLAPPPGDSIHPGHSPPPPCSLSPVNMNP